MVVFTHMLAPYPHVDPGYSPSPVFWKFEAGQGAVLFFFVLSGYVIGLTNHRAFSGAAVVGYARRRAVRLLPLYFLAVALSVAAIPTELLRTVVGNLLFLQNELPYGTHHFLLLAANTNLWSLNYEVLYYALFPLVWMTAAHWPRWLLGTAAVGAIAWRLPQFGDLIATYAAGWTFWLAGFGLARAPQVPPDEPANRLPWPSLMLLGLAIWHLKPMWWLGHRFGLVPEHGWMNYTFYDFIPACLALIMAATGRRPRGWRLILQGALWLPLAYLAWRFFRGRLFVDDLKIDDGLCLLGAALWWWRPGPRALAWVAPVGAISYAIYIFHSPIQEMVIRHAGLPSGSPATFALRCGVILALVVAASWLGERVLQPWLRRRLGPPAVAPAPSHSPVR